MIPLVLGEFEWVFAYFEIIFSFVEDVAGEINGFAEGGFGGDVFACNIIACAVVGRGADDGQSCREIDARIEGNGLESHQSLIVIHGKNAIEIVISARAEKTVGRVRTHDDHLDRKSVV